MKNTVSQHDLSGKLIRKWQSASEAAKELSLWSGHILRCCRGERKTTGGFMWKFI